MSLYREAKTKVRAESKFSEKFLAQDCVRKRFVLSPLNFAIAVGAIKKNTRDGLMNEILYVDDLVSMSENIGNLRKKFLKWKELFESKI